MLVYTNKEGIIKLTKLTIILLVLLFLISLISLFIGAYDVSIKGLIENGTHQLLVMLASRIPRLMAILCTGMGMSVAGLIMQNLCMNKFVSPSTGATISSAQLGIIIALVIFPSAGLITKTWMAFIVSSLGTLAFVWFIQRIKFKDIILVPLIGIMFNFVIGGVVNYIALENDLTQILSNMLVGDFSLILAERYEIVYLVLPLIIIAFIYSTYFNIVGLGENFSKNLGVNYKFMLGLGLIISSLITASIVVVVGTISYVGLIIPNIISMYKGDKIKNNLIDVALLGALYILICDIFGRIIIRPYELPIGLISGIIGSLLFIILMFNRVKPPKVKKA